MNEPIRVGDRVKIVEHFVMRYSPYRGRIGTVAYVPPDGQWPFVVAVPTFETAINGHTPGGRRYPWPTTFARNELAQVGDAGTEAER